MARWLKRIGLVLAGILGFLVLALVVLVVLLERGQLDGPISRQLTAALGRETVLRGPVDIGFGWQPSVTIGPLTIANPPGIEGDPFLHLPRAEAAISLADLLRGRIVIPRVIVTSPRHGWSASPTAGPTGSSARPSSRPTSPPVSPCSCRGSTSRRCAGVRSCSRTQ